MCERQHALCRLEDLQLLTRFSNNTRCLFVPIEVGFPTRECCNAAAKRPSWSQILWLCAEIGAYKLPYRRYSRDLFSPGFAGVENSVCKIANGRSFKSARFDTLNHSASEASASLEDRTGRRIARRPLAWVHPGVGGSRLNHFALCH